MSNRSILLSALFLCLMGGPILAEAPQPALPKEYDVQLRYRIRAGRNERILQYFAFIKFLEDAGFKKDPGPDNEPEDLTLNRMTGKIAATHVRGLLEDRHVKSLLLFPAGYKLPEDGATPVKVQIEIVGGRPIQVQREFYEQVKEQLAKLGYKEQFLYDHHGYTRLVGTVPAEQVGTLFNDLRTEPSGWFVPDEPVQSLPQLLREVSPLLVTEVIPEPAGVPPVKPLPEPVPVPKEQEKISPELRRVLGAEVGDDKPERMQLILAETPTPGDDTWHKRLVFKVPQMIIEGHVGPYVGIQLPLSKVQATAALPQVSLIRLPCSGTPLILPADDATGGNAAALKNSGLGRLHAQGLRGKGVRVAVISGDFRGWKDLLGKGLPKNTQLLDITSERNPTIEPDPEGEGKQGHGTLCALAAALAAPEAQFTLVHIDPAAVHQLKLVAAAINGDPLRSESLDARAADFEAENNRFRLRWRELIFERNVILRQFEQDEETVKRRNDHLEKVKEFQKEEAEYGKRVERFLRFKQALSDLRRTQVVISALYWNEGYPVDGSGALTRFLDSQPRNALWLQPAGETAGQVWSGLYRDADGNGAMEFAAPGTLLEARRWSPEFNFIGWQPFAGTRQGELPVNSALRVVFQWRELHDPFFARRGEDLYQEPLARIQLVLLRQRDPSGKKVGADEMEVVARSYGPALRIQNDADSATYEVTLDYTVAGPGQYALRVEGRAPDSTRPPGVPALGPTQRFGEMRPRIFIDVTDGNFRPVGRPVFLDYASDEGTIAMPGDSHQVFTVGAATRSNRPEPFSAPGPAMNLGTLPKPNFLSYDGLEVAVEGPKTVYGTSFSAAFAAGLAATTLSADVPTEALRRIWQMQPGVILRVPDRMPPPPNRNR
jgi:hypothetical protein